MFPIPRKLLPINIIKINTHELLWLRFKHKKNMATKWKILGKINGEGNVLKGEINPLVN